MPKRGEKGSAVIEWLMVVSILSILAVVVVPNVERFIGRGEPEAAKTELTNIQTAVVVMMVDNRLVELPAGTFVSVSDATDNMSAFPSNAVCETAKINDPDGDAYTVASGDKDGYILYQHDINGGDGPANLVNYVATKITKGTYYVDASGTVYQKYTGYE